jgi:hypothetical protein
VPSDQTLSRTLHDLGAAAWFGGSLMGASALNRAAAAAPSSSDQLRVEDAGWAAWQPWKTAAIAAHVAGSLGLLWGNKGRLAGQRGAMAVNVTKTGVFAAALGADLYAAALGQRIAQASSAVGVGGDGSVSAPDPDQHQRLRAVQWSVPVLTGINVALGAKMGEQQRATNLLSGLAARFTPGR